MKIVTRGAAPGGSTVPISQTSLVIWGQIIKSVYADSKSVPWSRRKKNRSVEVISYGFRMSSVG